MGVASVTPHQSTPSVHIQPRPLCGNIMAARNEKQIKHQFIEWSTINKRHYFQRITTTWIAFNGVQR